MIRNFSSSGRFRRRSTDVMIPRAMSETVLTHVRKDTMLRPVPPIRPGPQPQSRADAYTFFSSSRRILFLNGRTDDQKAHLFKSIVEHAAQAGFSDDDIMK